MDQNSKLTLRCIYGAFAVLIAISFYAALLAAGFSPLF